MSKNLGMSSKISIFAAYCPFFSTQKRVLATLDAKES